MRIENICTSRSLYRDDFRIEGYVFGSGKQSVCVIGNMRGNEYQQLYLCSQLVQLLKKAEQEDRIYPGHEILVIPSANPFSMNVQKRFWPIDNTDINRMFPGYMEGETTQRIAGVIFEHVKDYDYGIQFTSNYMPGEFMPYISMMKTGFENVELAKKFEAPYVVLRNTRPYDTTTLNYNWQIWETHAFSVYSSTTDRISRESTQSTLRSVMAFLDNIGVVKTPHPGGYISQVVDDDNMIFIRANRAGFFEPQVKVQQEVRAGALLARVVNPMDGEVLEEIRAPHAGLVFFMHSDPMTHGHTAVIKLIPT